MGTGGQRVFVRVSQYLPVDAAGARRPLESNMKSISLELLGAVMVAAAVAAACGGGSSGDSQPQAAAVATAAQAAAPQWRHIPAVSHVDAEPLAAAAAAAKPAHATDGPRVQVVGIAGSARGRLAMVVVGTAAPVLLKEGDSIAGESLLRIGVDHIVLGRPGHSRTIRVGVEMNAPEVASAATGPSGTNAAPPDGARSPLASNRAFEQMLSQRLGRASP